MTSKTKTLLLTFFTSALAISWWVCIVWMFVIAFKPATASVTHISSWFTPPFTLDNFQFVLNNPQADVGRWLMNSVIVSVVTTAVTLVLATLAAFAFSRIRFPLKGFWFWLIVASLMLPTEATLIPLFILMRDLGLLNTYASLILPVVPSAFALIVLKQFIDALPAELFDAANIDGAGWLRVFIAIVIPLCKPAVAAVGIFVFLGSWNNFTWPFISITDPSIMTLPVGLPFFNSQFTASMGYTMAANAIAAFPVLIVFFMLQKYIIRGITFSGMKL